ncbi:site-specific integrase [Marinomonas lutimaris]|uniref:site-specific integrase n=1 Tax=Marinomonas lutimaris TaxID=2846746 RepID=UPI001C6764D7|nr:site-specific integrase [Marinomonas lutimaris]
MESSATGKYHVVLIQTVEGIHNFVVPALYIKEDKKTVLFRALIDYHTHFYGRSLSWKRNVSRSVGLFFDYCRAFNEAYPDIDMFSEKRKIIRHFAIAYQNGTINPNSNEDKLKLYWPPAGNNLTKKVISSLKNFIEWCVIEGIIEGKVARNISKINQQNTLRFIYEAQLIKSKSILSHVINTQSLQNRIKNREDSNLIYLGKDPTGHIKSAEGKIFPSHLIVPLITQGFVTQTGEDITAKMYTLLLLFGALRVSEPCHLWFNDIVPKHNGSCITLLRHPSEALTFIDGEYIKTRRQYLAERGILPRNDDSNTNSYHAGWKDLKLDETKSALVWFIHESAESLFRDMYFKYMRYRESLMRIRRAKGLEDHPFLFVLNDSKNQGEPYSINAYNKALSRAYDRLEKKLGITIPRGKYSGTSPHGMRHFSGQELSDAGVDQKVIQNVLHQRSVFSQKIYTEPKMAKIASILEDAKSRIANTNPGLDLLTPN